MKQALRYFSLGLLLSALISFSVYYFSNPSTKIANKSTDEMISTIENDGYHVLTEDEYIDFRVKDDKNADKQEQKDKKKDDEKQASEDKKENEKDKNESAEKEDKKKETSNTEKKKDNQDKKDKKDDDKKEKSSKKVKVTVKNGMASQDVADLLKDKGIVKDSNKFVKYMEDNNISQSMQIGTFELTKDMSYDEIGKALQTYPGN